MSAKSPHFFLYLYSYNKPMTTELLDKITEFSNQTLQGSGLFMVDLEVKGSESKYVISVFVDSEHDGVNIDQCAKVSREIIFLIESHEVIAGKFTLNVSSPGLDRPLKDRRQFAKNTGRLAAVKFTAEAGSSSVKGKLTEVTDSGIVLTTDKGTSHFVSWENLSEIKILPAF